MDRVRFDLAIKMKNNDTNTLPKDTLKQRLKQFTCMMVLRLEELICGLLYDFENPPIVTIGKLDENCENTIFSTFPETK